jgi:type I restriction enzyme M protein
MGDPVTYCVVDILNDWLSLNKRESALKKDLKDAIAQLDKLAYEHYPALTEDEVKDLVVNDKWMAALDAAIHGEMDRVSQSLTKRVKELVERYESPLPALSEAVIGLEGKVSGHLAKMGFSWR